MNAVPSKRPRHRASVESLLASGKLEAAEQQCARLVKAGATAHDAAPILAVAKACMDVGRTPQAARWLARVPASATAAQAVEAARMAFRIGKPLLACKLFTLADDRGPLDAWDGLDHAQAALMAAEKARQPRGRSGAWARHTALLDTAQRLFSRLASSEAPGEYRASAWLGLSRVLRLQRADADVVAAAANEAARLLDDHSPRARSTDVSPSPAGTSGAAGDDGALP